MEQTKGLDLCLKGQGQFMHIVETDGIVHKKCLNCGLVVPATRYYSILEQSTGEPIQNSYLLEDWGRFCIQLHIIEGLRQ
jgi:hypothetical protein